jgi:hypothetical protein
MAGKACVYANKAGKTSTICRHFDAHHKKAWQLSCITFKLKNWEAYMEATSEQTKDSSQLARPYKPSDWSMEGFLNRLVRFIVADDQVA